MSPKRTNGKVVVSPVKFTAGGNKAKSTSSKKNVAAAVKSSSSLSRQNEDQAAVSSRNNNSEDRNLTSPPPTNNPSIQQPHNTYQWVQSGLQKKKSPLHIKHWIATVLTLDGRDKFTKLLQYSSRLLGWYFAGLAVRSTVSGSGSVSTTTNNNGQMNSQLIYQALSQRFTSLYKALVTSRKAFRMGRSIIEWDKIRSMGWGDYLGYWMTHPLVEGGVSSTNKDEEEEGWRMMDGGGGGQGSELLLRRDTHPIPEEDENDVDDEHDEEDDDDNSWNGQEPSNATMEEKKDDPQQLSSTKVISRPGRPFLPSRISSNIGWGPSNTTTAVETSSSSREAHHSPSPPSRTVSEMGRQMYRPYPSQSSSTSFGSYQQLKGTTTTSSSTVAKQPPSTPGWKLIGGTLKLLGLMGFWTFDNLSFLTSSGFLDPITTTTTSSSNGGGKDSNNSVTAITTLRTKRKQRASEYAARCYFMGGLAGLYVNLRSFWIHRNGPLREARRKCLDESSTTSNNDDNDGSKSSSSTAQTALKKTEQKHFELFLALLKSICDVTVFSNNPGIDLHLKLRGKKNHEGLHCLCGLISAGTVLYNNFPNAE